MIIQDIGTDYNYRYQQFAWKFYKLSSRDHETNFLNHSFISNIEYILVFNNLSHTQKISRMLRYFGCLTFCDLLKITKKCMFSDNFIWMNMR